MNISCDILGIYLYLSGSTPQRSLADTVTLRKQLWDHIEKILYTLPKRNFVLLAGDWNPPLIPSANLVGPDVSESPIIVRQTDQLNFQNLIEHHQFFAVNTWPWHLYRFGYQIHSN